MIMLNRQASINWLWVIPLIGLYLWTIRQSLILVSENEGLSFNFWDLILQGINDVYLINYLMFPLFLFKIGHQLGRSFEYTQLIRFGSYSRWIVQQSKEFTLFSVGLLFLWNASAFVLASGLSFSLDWSVFSHLERDGNEILTTLSSSFSSPVKAWVVQFLLFFLTMTVIHLLASILYASSKSKWLLNSFLTFLFIMSILSFKVIPASFKWISLPNYLSVFHGTASFGHFFIPFVILIGVFIIALTSLLFIGRDSPFLRSLFKEHWAIILFSGFIGFFLLVKAFQFQEEQMTVIDYWILSFFGTTHEGFDFLSFSFYLIVFLGFIYFVQLFLHIQLTKMNYASIIRHQSLVKWFSEWFMKIQGYVLLYLALLMSAALLIGMGFDFPQTGLSLLFPEVSLYIVLYHFWVNGFLQLTFYILLTILVSLLTGDVMKSFTVLLGMSIFMFPGMNFNYLIPFGLNSMGLLLETTSIMHHSVVLLIYNLVLMILLIYVLRKKDFNF